MAVPNTSELLRSVLQQEKELLFRSNTHLSQEEREQLWNRRIGELTGSSTSQTTCYGTRTGSGKRSWSDVPRTTISTAPPSKRRVSSSETTPQLARHYSQGSTPASIQMERKGSNKSQTGNVPFSGNGSTTPLHQSSRIVSSSWSPATEDPWSPSTLRTELPRRSSGTHRPKQPRLEDVTEYNPAEYVGQLQDDTAGVPSLSVTPSPALARGEFPEFDTHRLSVSSDQILDFGGLVDRSNSPSTPTTGELTNASTMSRSTTCNSIMGGLEMFRFDSSNVSHLDLSTGEHCSPVDFNHSASKRMEDTLLFPNHSSFSDVSSDFHIVNFPQSYLSNGVPVPFSLSTPIEKSMSSESSSSSSSTQSRLQRSRQEQIARASRPIMPKLADGNFQTNVAPDHKMVRVESSDGTLKDVAQIPKAPYVRPMHPKAFCPHCQDHKEGFRGEHELRRHIDRAHKITRKVWVCVDISPDKKFLANCKACRNKKTYNAYYNAAAHLRRTHFNPCTRGRGGRGKGDEKRGGKGGGLYPPMETLKEWMVETVGDNSSPLIDDDMMGEMDEDTYFHTPVSNSSYEYPQQTAYSTYEVVPPQISTQIIDVNSQFPNNYDYVSSSSMNLSLESYLSSVHPLDAELEFPSAQC